jgi:NAD(P)-dependent dehydrogenase (short-subunit alcohol dehydrogenase family)
MISDFRNKTAVLTGAGSGFGLECARIGAKLGMNLVLADVQQDALDRAVAEMEAAGAHVLGMRVDVSKADQVEALGAATLARFGAPHFVFNNAGVGSGGLIWENSLQDWEWVIGVNLMGVAHGIRVFTPMMLAAAQKDAAFQGHIVNTASMAGLLNAPNMGIYNASKHALVGLTRCAAVELGPLGICVNAICPGFVETDMLQSFSAHSAITGLSFEQIMANGKARVPLRRFLQPVEIAHLAVYLGSSESDGMTGQSILMDGGMLMV